MRDPIYYFIAAIPLVTTVGGLVLATKANFREESSKATAGWLLFSFVFPILYLLGDAYWESHINTDTSRGWTLIPTFPAVIISVLATITVSIALLGRRIRKAAKS